MRLFPSLAIAALMLTLVAAGPARGEDAVESTTTATSSVSTSEESSSTSEAPESAHPDCMKSCLEEDEFLFDCASYCILTV